MQLHQWLCLRDWLSPCLLRNRMFTTVVLVLWNCLTKSQWLNDLFFWNCTVFKMSACNLVLSCLLKGSDGVMVLIDNWFGILWVIYIQVCPSAIPICMWASTHLHQTRLYALSFVIWCIWSQTFYQCEKSHMVSHNSNKMTLKVTMTTNIEVVFATFVVLKSTIILIHVITFRPLEYPWFWQLWIGEFKDLSFHQFQNMTGSLICFLIWATVY